jgi:protoheme IX farnesyltransferase
VTQPHLQSAIAATPLARSRTSVRDFVALAKPRITLMVIITTAGGLFLAPRVAPLSSISEGGTSLSAWTVFFALLGTSMIVSGANALNMYIERDIDRHMARTRNRPLPAGRMSPRAALWFGVTLSVVSVPILAIGVNALTALLAVLANVSYVLAYTPMKPRSHFALEIGAVPGAIPPLLGWTAATNRIDPAGVVLFATLFLWQIPHFHAIAMFRREEYARAGLKVMPNVAGDDATKHVIVRYLAALVATSLLLFPLGVAHAGYLFIALALGAVFFGWGVYGLRPGLTDARLNRWARSLFAISIVYLVLLFAALSIDPFA